MMPPLPVSTEVILEELGAVRRILEKWELTIRDQGIPAVETEAPAEDMTYFLKQFCGELEICSSRIHSLGAVIDESL